MSTTTATPTPTTASAPHILVIGSLNMDLTTVTPRLPSAGETLTATSFETLAGGKGANQAVAAARSSRGRSTPAAGATVRVSMAGAVGDDAYGRELVRVLSGDGVDVSGVESATDRPTGVAVVIVESGTGQNRILLSTGANAAVSPSRFTALPVPLPALVVLQLEISRETVLAVLEAARRAGVHVLLNAAPAAGLPDRAYQGLAHLVVNESEAAALAAPPAEGGTRPAAAATTTDGPVPLAPLFARFEALGVRQTVVTLGERGVAWSVGGGQGAWESMDAVPGVVAVDTTGAGDTFVGAYAVGIVEGMVAEGGPELRAVVDRANRAAARSVQRRGAMDSIPWRDEV